MHFAGEDKKQNVLCPADMVLYKEKRFIHLLLLVLIQLAWDKMTCLDSISRKSLTPG